MKDQINSIRSRLVNLQRSIVRLQSEKERDDREAQSQMDTLLLEIVDGLQTLKNVADRLNGLVDSDDKKLNSSLKSLGHGVQRFERLLRDRDVHEIDLSQGEVIPGKCRVVSTESNPELRDGAIGDIVRAGYMRHERVLRPADVTVIRSE